MSSKLYRAIVGVGISLGASSVACFASVDNDAISAGNDGGPAASQEAGADSGTTADAEAPDARRVDATFDATVVPDAAVDAPRDVILDAFCDATWPTTKGSMSGPTCGPVTGCGDAGAAPRCFRALGPSNCETTGGPVPSWCVDGEWECSEGSVPEEECKCWGPLDAGQPCP